jgi:hypothetical protein
MRAAEFVCRESKKSRKAHGFMIAPKTRIGTKMGPVSMVGAREQQTLQLLSADGPGGGVAEHVHHQPRPHSALHGLLSSLPTRGISTNTSTVPRSLPKPSSLSISPLVFANPKSPLRFHWTKFVLSSPTASLSSPRSRRKTRAMCRRRCAIW